jgi:hypothetical protein
LTVKSAREIKRGEEREKASKVVVWVKDKMIELRTRTSEECGERERKWNSCGDCGV